MLADTPAYVYSCLACSHDAVLLFHLHELGGFLQRLACSSQV